MALVHFSAGLHRSCSVSTISNKTLIVTRTGAHDFTRCGAYSELLEKQLRKDGASSQEAYAIEKHISGQSAKLSSANFDRTVQVIAEVIYQVVIHKEFPPKP